VSLASTPYREAIAARLAPLRDFLLLFFFIALGASLDLTVLGASVGAAVVFSLFVLIGNPLIVLAIMAAMGYRRRTGFLAGLTVAQISEFSLIFMAMGVALGHVAGEALGLVTLVGLITIAVSTYMITYSHQLYRVVEPALALLGPRRSTSREDDWGPIEGRHDVVVFGLGRYGLAIAEELREAGSRVLGVDFSPVAVRHARACGFEALYGDASDPEFLGHLRLEGVAWAVAAVPEHDTGITHNDARHTLIHALRESSFSGRIAAAAYTSQMADKLAATGIDLVLMPFRDAALHAASMILERSEPTNRPLVDPEGQRELA
jgi:hypothetical protein